MKAFFKRAADNTADATKTNEQKIKEEAARRKQLREAKEMEKAATAIAVTKKSAEEVAAEVAALKLQNDAKEAAERDRIAKEELAARQARKAAINAKFSSAGGASPTK
jgi:hypothetical protein